MSANPGYKDYDTLYKEYEAKKAKILAMGGPKAVENHHKSGKKTARERIDMLFDPGSFTEFGMWIKNRTTELGMAGKDLPAEGVVVGVGRVNGRLVAAAAEDFTTMAGTFGEYHGKKFADMIDFAKLKGIPFIGMNDSGGARLQEGMDTLEAYAWLFRSQILASGIVPQIALLLGPCLGGQAYHPIMQDFIIQSRQNGAMGIAGPAFVKTQTGEDISLEKLCGVQAHAVKAGQTHIVGQDDEDCINKAKELLSFFPQNNREKPASIECTDDPERADVDLDTIMPEDPMRPWDMHEVIKRIVDNGYFFEILKDFAKNVIVGFARFNGRVTGIVASQPNWLAGAIDCDAADKVARFVRTCDLFNIPLVNLHDTPAFWIGSEQEHKGILRHGAKMLYAYIDATVPKITVILRKTFAGAYLAMCCKDTGADIVFAWPTSRITIVGAESAASVIFAKEIKNSADPKATAAARIQEYRDLFEHPYHAAARGYVDDVIMPHDTRKKIIRALEITENKQEVRPARKYSNINL